MEQLKFGCVKEFCFNTNCAKNYFGKSFFRICIPAYFYSVDFHLYDDLICDKNL